MAAGAQQIENGIYRPPVGLVFSRPKLRRTFYAQLESRHFHTASLRNELSSRVTASEIELGSQARSSTERGGS
jgi:hypothetical protein